MINDETLMAYADGQLSALEVALVDKAIAEDSALSARLRLFADSRVAVQAAFGAQAAVPDALTERIRAMAQADEQQRRGAISTNVVSLIDRSRTVPFWQLPIAASIALGVGLLGGWAGTRGGDESGGLLLAGGNDPALVASLGTLRSGARAQIDGGAKVALISSFRSPDGSLCREFEHDEPGGRTVVAVACNAANGWTVNFAVAAAATNADGYAPASSLDALDAWLGATEAGAPLSDDEEKAALDALR